MIKVLKFGGSSVNSAEKMQNIKRILLGKGGKLLVVLSACRGITDMLYSLAEEAKNSDISKVDHYIEQIRSLHYAIINDLDFKNESARIAAKSKIDSLCNELSQLAGGIGLLHELTPRSTAATVSFGEMFSTTIFFEYLDDWKTENTVSFCNAGKIMTVQRINEQSVIPDMNITFANCQKFLLPKFNGENSCIITQGFIASDTDGHPAILSRGGSDYSAAVFAAGLHADELEIWTDVSGIYTSDPRVYKTARTIPQMTYEEVAKLSFFGAKVLHPATVKPAIDYNIPLRVLNTLEPENAGTLLTSQCNSKNPLLSAFSDLENIVVIEYNNNVVKRNDTVTSILTKYNLKTYFSVYAAGNHRIFCDAVSPDQAKEFPNEIRISPAFCICIVGNNLSPASEPFKEITTSLSNNNKVMDISLITANCIIVAGKFSENNKELFSSIHKLVLKYNK